MLRILEFFFREAECFYNRVSTHKLPKLFPGHVYLPLGLKQHWLKQLIHVLFWMFPACPYSTGETPSMMKKYCSTRLHILCNFGSVLLCENLQLSILGASVKLNFSWESFLYWSFCFVRWAAHLRSHLHHPSSWWHNSTTPLPVLSL